MIKKFYDIGIAVAAPDGLVVPVVRDADRKTFADIERDIGEPCEESEKQQIVAQRAFKAGPLRSQTEERSVHCYRLRF